MATQTANLGLTLPIGSEKVKRQVINSNNEIIDAAVGKIEDGIAYRLGETNTTGATLAVGTYVYVSGNSTLAEGLYTVSTAIGTGITLSASNCTAVSGGGLNALNSNLTTVEDAVKILYHKRNISATSIEVPWINTNWSCGLFMCNISGFGNVIGYVNFTGSNTGAITYVTGSGANITATYSNSKVTFATPTGSFAHFTCIGL